MGYIGIVIIGVLDIWWIRHSGDNRRESACHASIRELMTQWDDPNQGFIAQDVGQLNSVAGNSSAERDVITAAIDLELNHGGRGQSISVLAKQR